MVAPKELRNKSLSYFLAATECQIVGAAAGIAKTTVGSWVDEPAGRPYYLRCHRGPGEGCLIIKVTSQVGRISR